MTDGINGKTKASRGGAVWHKKFVLGIANRNRQFLLR